MKPNPWYLFPGILALLASLSLPLSQSQMVPVSGVIDHPIESKPQEKDQEASSAKSHAHVEIARKHLAEEMERSSEPSKVKRKDKPQEFQNPAKHASEEGLLHFLLEQYKLSGDNDQQKLEILENLENFSHKFENGRDLFANTDALTTILLPAINSSSPEIRKAACTIFAIAGQNNAVVQMKSVEAGAVRLLMHLVTFDKAVRSKALFAVGSLVRNYPDAQKELINLGGVSEIVKIAFLPETWRRSLTFLMDLINERNFCDIYQSYNTKFAKENALASDNPCDVLGLLTNALRTSTWCELLKESAENLSSFDTTDQILVIEAVETSLELCPSKFLHLGSQFEPLLDKYAYDSEFESVKIRIQNVLAALSSSQTVSSHSSHQEL